MHNEAARLVYVCTDAELKLDEYYCDVWRATKNIEISRREWLDLLADCFCAFSGDIRWPSGDTYEIPMIDETFGDDPDCRWFSYFLKAGEDENLPLSKSRMFERIRLIDLFFKIRYPALAEKFGER